MSRRKVNCIVIYDSLKFEVYNVTVKTKEHNSIQLFNPFLGVVNCKKYVNFKECQQFVLKLLKNNDFYVHTWKEANTTFYDIDFVDVNRKTVNRYCYQ